MDQKEQQQLSEKLVTLTLEVNNLKAEKKAVVKEYQENINEKEAQINKIAQELDLYNNNGYIISYNGGTVYQLGPNNQETKLFSSPNLCN
jgi:hypothetical protein